MKKLILGTLIICSVARAEVVERIVAVVNSEIVTESDLRAFSKKLSSNGMIDELLLFGARADDIKNNRKAQLDYLISERLLDSEVKRLNLSVTIEKVEQEIREVAKRNGMGRADLLAAVKGQGVSPSEYQAFMKTRIERQALIENEITSKVRVSDEDVLAQYIRQHPEANTGSFEYTLAHIFFNPKKGGVAAAKDRAEAALKKIKSGESFDAVAEQFSEDPNFATGGLLGTFKAGEFSKELEQSVQNLNSGELSEVVVGKAGIHILKILSKKVITDPRFDKEKEKIRNQLFEAAFQKNFKAWIESKRDDSFVRVNAL